MSSLTTENAKSSKSWPRVKLGEVAAEIRDRINSSQISAEQYVTTENMVKDRGGVVSADSMPNGVGLVRYCIGDVLIANIRPYLKKIWLSNREGGCSSDVVVYRATNAELTPEYLHLALSSDDFFDHVMRKTRGTKMPRGDREWMLQFEIPLPPLAVQREIVSRLKKELAAVERMAKGFEALKAEADQLFKSTLKETFEVVSRGGAETRRLGDVGEVFRGDYITRKTERAGSIPVVLGGREPGYYINRFNHEGPCLVVSRSGASAGYVSYWNEPIFITDGFGIEVGDAIDIRFLHYQILSNGGFSSGQDGAAIPHVTCRIIRDREVYLPPLPTQREIVAKLDAARERCEKLKRAAEEGLQTAALMRKAILKEAFA